jgi:predicted dehydrogenase
MAQRLDRRRFLRTAAAGGAIGFFSGRLSGDERRPSANDRLHVGVIGVTGRGGEDLNAVANTSARIVALCDVDEEHAGEVRSRFPDAAFHVDFRRLIDQKGLDAVVVGIPDHTHVFATLAALRAGLDVYCEKPLTHSVAEARLVAETADREGRVTQMGTQIHAEDNYRRVVELVRAGAVGPVRAVHIWCDKVNAGGERPKETPPVPKGLHYDLWLGAAPYRPYSPKYIPFHWRGWWDFGGGTLADMACHYMDLAFWALGLSHPTRIAAEGPPVHPESAPRWVIVRYEFSDRAGRPLSLTWYDGGKRPKAPEGVTLPEWKAGVLFVGEEGALVADYTRRVLLPEERFRDYRPPQPSLRESVGHHREWVNACKTRGRTSCHFGYGGALTEAVLLGVAAYRLSRPLEWDARQLRAVNEPDAERLIHKEYRKPWTL